MHDRKSPLETKFQLAILAETHDGMDGLSDIFSIAWLRCKQTGDYSFDFYKDDAIVSSVNLESSCFDLQDLLGIIVVGDTDAFDGIRDKWSTELPSSEIAFRRIPEWDSRAILSAAIECLAENLRLQRCQSGRASLELSTYRREFDRLQRSFARLEEYVGLRSVPRSIEVFEYPPILEAATKKGLGVPADHVSTHIDLCLTQYLPVDSLGLSSISIYTSAKPEDLGEPLYVKLKAIETDHIFAAWSLDPAGLEVGWVQLALSHAIDEAALSLEVIFECSMQNSGWSLALGSPHPYKEFCAHTDAGEYLGAPIAMRLFSSLPGVRVAPTTNAKRPIDSPPFQSQFVPYETYGTIVQVLPPHWDSKPALVFYDREIGCLVVHPRIGGLTAGRMNVTVPKGAWGISAQIHLAHEEAKPTDFGLLVCSPRDEKASLARLNQLESPSACFSGWKTLAPLESGSILAFLGASPEDELSIFLVTRQAPGLSSNYAWARFDKLEFNILPISLLGLSSSDEMNPSGAGFVRGDAELVVEVESVENHSDVP